MPADTLGDVPRQPEDLSPQWLTACLKDSGHLPSGTVTAVAATRAEKWHLAQPARLTVTYSDSAPAEAPRRLFAKLAKSDDPLADIFPGEIAFYRNAPSDGLPLVRCYGAHLDQRTGASCLLLEDLTDSHDQPPWPLPPPLPQCEAAVEALARLHGHWWHGGNAAEDRPSLAALQANEARLATHFQKLLPAFLDNLGDRLSAERRALMERALERLPALKGIRLSRDRAITRVHGDAHFWNVLYPKDPTRDGCVFIDWEDWRHDIAGADLAYMIALHWYPERRARHERDLLERYRQALEREISSPYGWDELFADYRLGCLQNIVVPIFLQQAGFSPGIWWSHLERWFLGIDDLGCRELL